MQPAPPGFGPAYYRSTMSSDTEGVTRRELLQTSLAAALSAALPTKGSTTATRPLRVAILADIHHGLAPDALTRLRAFVAAVRERDDLDLVIQMGDFCHAEDSSREFLRTWQEIRQPVLHVLGNHDMDKVDKPTAMSFWGMKERYGAYDFRDFRILVLDLNHFRKGGVLFPYNKGNYFTDNATHNWADPEQLDWLRRVLRTGDKPTILLSHQPLGFAEPGTRLPTEQQEVLDIVTAAAKDHPRGAVVACLCGHMHVDRLERHAGIPCFCFNSASYFWSSGMFAYSKPLFAFVEFGPETMKIEGVVGEFVKGPPAASASVAGRSASIADRRVELRE